MAVAPTEKLTKYGWFVALMALGGWGLGSMDGSFFTFAMPPIMQELKIDLVGIGYLYTIAFGVGWVATIVAGLLLDYWGRKKTFQLTIIATVVGSVLSAVSWGFWSLTAFRSITSAGNGAEWPAGQQLVTEEVPARLRGSLVGIAQVGWPVGWFIAVLIAMVVIPTLGWRWLFVVGVIPGILVIIARRWMREPPRAVDVERLRAKARDEAEAKKVETEFAVAKEKAVHFTFRQLFEPDLLRVTITIPLFMLLHNLGGAVAQFYMPVMVMGLGYTLNDSYVVGAWAFGCTIFGYLFQGWLGDRIGRKAAMLIFVPFAMAGFWCLANYSTSFGLLALFYTIAFFFQASLYTSMIAFGLESYPTRARGIGGALVIGMCWFGNMLTGLIGPRLIEAYGVSGTFILMGVIVMFVGWIVLWCTRGVAPGKTLEEVAI